jgi:LmbE family N-acetylglucosaminyl deacetylase
MLKKVRTFYRSKVKKLKKNSHVRAAQKYVSTHTFENRYFKTSLIILFSGSTYWAYIGAKIQLSNADQLINSMLFESASTFHGALLPSTHSFLIKWPLFLLIKSAGLTAGAYIVATVVLVLATIGIFARILYKIESRKLNIGTIYLGLSSVLMLVPTVAYSGALLPVNMAMATTRNIEYALFILALICIIKARNSIRSKYVWIAVILLGLLFASDKLYLSISFAASIFLLVIYSLARKWDFAKVWLRWLALSLAATIFAIGLLMVINKLGLTNIVSGGAVTPYAFIANLKDIAIGASYAIMGIFTNFGANPAYDVMVLKDVPIHALHKLLAPSGPAYIINAIFLLSIVGYGIWLLKASFTKKPPHAKKPRFGIVLSVMLIATSIASIGSYILTQHYYPADARYLSVIFFTAFVCLASFSSAKRWKKLPLSFVGLLFIASSLLGIFGSLKIYHNDSAALSQTNNQNYLVSRALESHKVNVLVGDYWRVVPTNFIAKNNVKIAPLASCSQFRDTLTSKQWQPNLQNTSFAYLLSLKKGLTDFPACSYEDVLKNFGRPSSSALISGTLENPEELLLFYDGGVHKQNSRQPTNTQKESPTALPLPLNKIQATGCADTTTVMQIVAHQDDDLLFMSPDLLGDISERRCLRTIYVTAGDSGSNEFYWLKREQGSEAAYSFMLGTNEGWSQKTVKLPGGQFASFASPRGNPRVTLIFLHLPDGGLNGQGFPGFHHESIAELQNGTIPKTGTVDQQSSYTRESLVTALADIMRVYAPSTVKAQSVERGEGSIPDHSDHNATGKLATDAFNRYAASFPDNAKPNLTHYLGYPVRLLAPNVPSPEFMQKTEAFIHYAQFDNAVCQSMEVCERTETYYGYLSRQYTDLK